ncbi:MAG: class I SAM-dependent methyltransferase, partial [Candidatus Aminicenantes bacterium]|nr:class I SAM-dependent methyltransferase [Candidatus Aminicenantes bacterium]
SPSGALDLHLKNKKKYPLEFTLDPPGAPLLHPDDLDFKPLTVKPDAEVDFTGVAMPVHISKELLSYFPKAAGSDSLVLDLGCGYAIHRQVCEHAGFEYVGLDYQAPGAPISGDAHALPFKDNSFEFILSVAVFEHIRYPFVMIREAYRVLKPGGKLIGTVAFLEPFHGNSFYHHTHSGVFNTLHYGGFAIERIAPGERWSVFAAQAHMARLFPRMPRRLSGFIVRLPHLLSKLWWRIGGLVYPKSRNSRFECIRDTTGAFAFIAGKEIKAGRV